MARARLRRQIALPLLVLVAVALGALTWQASLLLHDFHLQRTEAELTARAALVEEVLGERLRQPRREQIDPIAKRLGMLAAMRVTIVGADGVVLGESDKDPALMDNHARRPEIAAALGGTSGTAIRYSDTVERPMMYAARPVFSGDRVIGVVRTGLALEAVEAALRSLYLRSAAAALAVLLVAALLGLWTTRRITRPLEELEGSADRYARGDVTAPVPVGGSVEIARVANAMHRSAVELDARIRALVAERNEQEAVLASMVEGVLAVDRGERVMALNAAAAGLLGIDARQAIGRSIQEVARNAELQRFVSDVIATGEAAERDIVMHGDDARSVQAHGAPVRDHAGERIGVVVVLNDVTRLRRLETVRRDFVANVSHELRTPITSIKGFLETLLAGAIDDAANARRFVEIASRQSDRLGAIIDDLLLLSRVEQESEQCSIDRAPVSIDAVVAGAIEVCALKAEQKGVTVVAQCQPGVGARINAALVEQALVNLIDNAIKYSDPGATVEILAECEGSDAVVRVRDHGAGIDAEHLPRLFERFYRVDKARSRALGGTGLGLAIVKHIAAAQGGSVSVESKPGAGTTFSMRLPAA